MAATIILCFTLTLFSILTINSFSNTKVAAVTNLNASVDSVMHALQLEKTYDKGNYEEVVNDLLQNVILQADPNGILNVRILNANTEEGLLDVEIRKQFTWMGAKKEIVTKRTVILEEYDNPPAQAVTVYFMYNDGTDDIVWREENTYEGAILRRPKQPKRAGYDFDGWSLTEGGNKISDADWQDYIIDVPEGTTILTLYARFIPKA
jgi:uncharacterized repeat protein (TIGR02543 family)